MTGKKGTIREIVNHFQKIYDISTMKKIRKIIEGIENYDSTLVSENDYCKQLTIIKL